MGEGYDADSFVACSSAALEWYCAACAEWFFVEEGDYPSLNRAGKEICDRCVAAIQSAPASGQPPESP